MAEESEKRFRKIMDKLYHFPRAKPKPSTSSSSGVVSSWQKGRSLASAIGPKDSPNPRPCRPWDRGDLMRRLATFKAMTWFGKPKVIGPINCARRGWVNVDMDTIFCEACGSRLLFSTPSSSAFQQVEKAAAVFSLKLDSGHKMLCPWTDNICEESLALFPPTPATALVEGYKERASALLQLSALPVISSHAMDYMKSAKLDQFLKQSSSLTCTVDNDITLADNSNSMIMGSDSESAAASEYFQAQKLISLCGWELRLLPYFVDCEALGQSSERAESDSPGHIISKRNHDTVIYSSIACPMEVEGENNDQQLIEHQTDPTSAVFDCKSCGACVGLWAFKSVSRPLEFFSLSDLLDTNNKNDSSIHVNGSIELPRTDILDTVNQTPTCIGKDSSSNLKLTIAGGLPPTRQCFRPRVSLPIISRHLRAELYAKNFPTDFLGNAETLKRKRNVDEGSSPDGDNLSAYQLNGDNGTREVLLNIEERVLPTCEGRAYGNEDNLLVTGKNSKVTSDRSEEGSDGNNGLSRDSEDGRLLASSNPIFDNKLNEISCGHGDYSPGENATVDGINNMDLEKNKRRLDSQNSVDPNASDNSIHKLKKTTQSSVTNRLIVPFGKDLVPAQWKSAKEFDPIRQHRPFCPWIAPEDGEGMPGWKLTLSALVQEKDCSLAPVKDIQLGSLNEADDPVVSVRTLFTSPQSKRLRGNR